nr:YadA-like family protein [uncultured Desulfuromonas sp.]
MQRIGLLTVLLITCVLTASAWADHVITDNLIVTGKTGIGFDCSNGEVFDDTTLKLKENNLRILFDDTTVGATDWWIITNEAANGGANFFGISDHPVEEQLFYTLDEYIAATGDGNVLVDTTLVTFIGGSITSCTDFPTLNPTACPVGTTETNITHTVYYPVEAQDFWIDPSSNSFHITENTVFVGTEAAPRRLVNVSDGIEDNDVITVGQLTTAEDTLASVIALGNDPVAGADALATRLDEVESTIAPQEARLEGVESQLSTITAGVESAETTLADQGNQIDQLQSDVTALQSNLDNIAGDLATNSAAQEALATGIADTTTRATSNTEQISALATSAGAISATGNGTLVVSSTEGVGSTALGSGASARTRDTAVGYQATVTADGSVGVGADSFVESENSVALGADSHVAAETAGGVALGQAAQVSSGAGGAVAIGQQSVANEAQTVSVGSATNQRRITNVAAAQQDHDAVNFSQLMQLSNQFQNSLSQLVEQVGKADDRLDESGAMMMALSALLPNIRSQGTTQVSLGLGHYSGSNAIAGGIFHYLSDTVLLNAAISSAFSTDSTSLQTGVVISW